MTLHQQKWLASFAFLLISLFFFLTLSKTTPFIQHEMIGQAFWYGCEGNFLSTLLDPVKNDRYPGRFRYVEYLSQAVYWKLMNKGFLPRELYDYLSVFLNFLASGFIYLIAREKKLRLFPAVILCSLFLLSSPAYFVSVWHYRKAKVIASLLLLFLAYLSSQKKDEIRGKKALITAVHVLGVFTDPYYILIAPLIAGIKYARLTLFAYLGSAWLVLLVNGVIAPQFGTQTLKFWTLQNETKVFLSFENFKYAYGLLPDLLGLTYTGVYFKTIGWALLSGVALSAGYFRRNLKDMPFCAAFVFSLPLFVFLVRPSELSGIGIFASYYGHTAFVLFVLAMVELLLKKERTILVMCLLLVVGQQSIKAPLFEKWKQDHLMFGAGSISEKYEGDYTLLQNLKQNKALTAVPMDYSKFKFPDFSNAYPKTEGNHSSLGYLLLPVLFQKEIRENRLSFYDAETHEVWRPLCK